MNIEEIKKQMFLNKMMEGDSRAKWPLETRVRKSVMEPKDQHMVDTLGTVMGSMHSDELGDAYLVHFDGDADHVLCFITEKKLEIAEPA